MNGPIINKLSSTGELSSTGTGYVQSVYSAASTHQPSSIYASLPCDQTNATGCNHKTHPLPADTTVTSNHVQQGSSEAIIQPNKSLNNSHSNTSSHQSRRIPQPIYSQSMIPNSITAQQIPYQQNRQIINPQRRDQAKIYDPNHNYYASMQHTQTGSNVRTNQPINVPTQTNSLNRLPFSALANLPKHQQEMLQQTSIYATLSRQPNRSHKQPPPVPIRRESLKTNSMTDEVHGARSRINMSTMHQNVGHMNNDCRTTSTTSLYGYQYSLTSRSTPESTQSSNLTMNKSFSGNAHLDWRMLWNSKNSSYSNHGRLWCSVDGFRLYRSTLARNQNKTEANIYATILSSSKLFNSLSFISSVSQESMKFYRMVHHGTMTTFQ